MKEIRINDAEFPFVDVKEFCGFRLDGYGRFGGSVFPLGGCSRGVVFGSALVVVIGGREGTWGR